MHKKRLLITALLLFAAVCLAGELTYPIAGTGQSDSPPGSYRDNRDGTVSDLRTGLMRTLRQQNRHGLPGGGEICGNAESPELSRPSRLAHSDRQGVAEHRGLPAIRRDSKTGADLRATP